MDKILERATSPQPAEPSYAPAPGSYEHQRDQRRARTEQRYGSGLPGSGSYGTDSRKKRKKHWLEEIFD